MPDEKKTTPADGIEQPTQDIPAEQSSPGSEAPAPDKAAEEPAAPAHEGSEPPAQETPAEQPSPGSEAPAPDKAAEDAATPTHEGGEPPAQEQPAPDPAEAEREAALLREQQALRAEMDAREAAFEKSNRRTPKPPRAPKAPAANKQNRPGKPPKPDKAEKPGGEKPAPGAEEPKRRGRPPKAETAAKEETPPAPAVPEPPPQPREAPRPDEPEQIVYLNLTELHPFKDHPFGVRDDNEMKTLVASVKDKGVNQPAIVRPRPDGGYELIAGHRRQKASELAGYTNMPCIVRNLTDDEAVLAMTDDNLRQRSEILPSEKARSLTMQVEAIKHQGTRDASGQNVQNGEAGKLSIAIVGERNNMNAKQVQRFMRLTKLVPDLLKRADDKSLGFTTAIELSFISPRNQNFISVAMDAEQSVPSQSQAKRLRELDETKSLTSDAIDAILGEKKKEEIKVIITGAELDKYFGKDKTPQQMKEQIIKLLEDYAGKEKGHEALEQKQPDR